MNLLSQAVEEKGMMIRGHTILIHLWSFEGVGLLEVNNNNWNTVNILICHTNQVNQLFIDYNYYISPAPKQSSCSKWDDAEAAGWAIQPTNFLIPPMAVLFLEVLTWNAPISPWAKISCWNLCASRNIISCVMYFRVIIAFQLFSPDLRSALDIFLLD